MVSEEFAFLLDGRIFMAVTTMFQSIFGMWFVTILFLLFKSIIYLRTRNMALGFAVSSLFMGGVTGSAMLVGVGTEFLDSPAFRLVVTLMIFEFAGIMYNAIWRK